MAVLKDLIVHGSSRFLNKIYASQIQAESGIFNKLIAKDATMENATVVGLLDVKGQMHTSSWTNSNIATIKGSFYISPTIVIQESENSAVVVTETSLSFSGPTYTVNSLYLDNVNNAVLWSTGSKVLVTGEILNSNNEWIPLGTLSGEISTYSQNSIYIINLKDSKKQTSNILANLVETGVSINLPKYRNITISLCERKSNNKFYPVGIYITATGQNGKTFLDIYGGNEEVPTEQITYGGLTKPNVRIGNLQGLPAVANISPKGWGIYTTNGYFKGLIAADQGYIHGEVQATSFIAYDENSLERARVNTSGLLIKDTNGQISASFGNEVRIGKNEETHIDLDFHSLQLKDKEGNTYFYVSDLRDEYGRAHIIEDFPYSGRKKFYPSFSFYLYASVTEDYYPTVFINGVEQTEGYHITSYAGDSPPFNSIDFDNDIFQDGDIITINYYTTSSEVKGFTYGKRKNNTVIGANSYAIGYNVQASGRLSYAEGNETIAKNLGSHAEGDSTTASGQSSHAEGENTTASEAKAHSEGYNTLSSGTASHAEGYGTMASGDYSHAEGYNGLYSSSSDYFDNTLIKASGRGSHTEGYTTKASGYCSHAEGTSTTASGNYSHAEGDNTTTSGVSSHAEGRYTTASGYCSHAEGYYATASGNYSHAGGFRTIATSDYNFVIGKRNLRTSSVVDGETVYDAGDYPFIIGNGSADNVLSNALTVDWSGNLVVSGSITDGSGNVLSAKADATTVNTALAQKVDMTTPNINLDTSALSGTTDYDLYAAITALGWESEVIVT